MTLVVVTLRGFLETDATSRADGATRQVTSPPTKPGSAWVRPRGVTDCAILDTGAGEPVVPVFQAVGPWRR